MKTFAASILFFVLLMLFIFAGVYMIEFLRNLFENPERSNLIKALVFIIFMPLLVVCLIGILVCATGFLNSAMFFIYHILTKFFNIYTHRFTYL